MNSIPIIVTAVVLTFILIFWLIQREKDKKRMQAEEDKRQRLIFEKKTEQTNFLRSFISNIEVANNEINKLTTYSTGYLALNDVNNWLSNFSTWKSIVIK